MEDTATNSAQLGCLYFLGLFSWILELMNLSLQHLFQPLVKFVSTRCMVWTKIHKLNTELPPPHQSLFRNEAQDETVLVSKGEVEMVMDRLGMCYEAEGDDMGERVGAEELSGLFELEEPSMEELKEAFAVFDENKDGFIDAAELQRVLYDLGLRDGFGLNECQRMINAADRNEDGMIDFDEFLVHMENSFCCQND